MKLAITLALLFCVGFALAQQTDKPSVRDQLVARTREALAKVVEKAKERLDRHLEVGKGRRSQTCSVYLLRLGRELIRQGEVLARRLRQLHADVGPKVRDLLAKNGSRLRAFFQRVLEIINRGKREVEEAEFEDELDIFDFEDEEVREKRQALGGLQQFLNDLKVAGEPEPLTHSD